MDTIPSEENPVPIVSETAQVKAKKKQDGQSNKVDSQIQVKKKRPMKLPEKILCEFCSKEFKNLSSYKVHLRIHEKNKNGAKRKEKESIVCEYCAEQFTKSFQYTKHLRAAHHKAADDVTTEDNDKKSLTCEECPQTFGSKVNYERHAAMHAGKWPFSCDTCDKGFVRRYEFERHVKIHVPESEKKFPCGECDKRYSSREDLDAHTLVKHTPGGAPERRHQCSVCGKVFQKRGHLAEHELTHTGERKYLCEFCGVKMRDRSGYRRHTRRHLVELGHVAAAEIPAPARNFACGVCARRFRGRRALETHENTHTGATPFPCDLCGAAFRHPATARRHRQRCEKTRRGAPPGDGATSGGNSSAPTNSVRVTCEYCTASIRPCNYVKHVKRHVTGKLPGKGQTEGHGAGVSEKAPASERDASLPRNYACDLCGRRFRGRQALLLHTYTHTGETPFPCGHCARAFNHPSTCKRHQLTCGKPARAHREERDAEKRTLMCEICSKRFRYPTDLSRHVLTHQRSGPRFQKVKMIGRKAGEIILCEYCPMPFERPSVYRNHVIMHLRRGHRKYRQTGVTIDGLDEASFVEQDACSQDEATHAPVIHASCHGNPSQTVLEEFTDVDPELVTASQESASADRSGRGSGEGAGAAETGEITTGSVLVEQPDTTNTALIDQMTVNTTNTVPEVYQDTTSPVLEVIVHTTDTVFDIQLATTSSETTIIEIPEMTEEREVGADNSSSGTEPLDLPEQFMVTDNEGDVKDAAADPESSQRDRNLPGDGALPPGSREERDILVAESELTPEVVNILLQSNAEFHQAEGISDVINVGREEAVNAEPRIAPRDAPTLDHSNHEQVTVVTDDVDAAIVDDDLEIPEFPVEITQDAQIHDHSYKIPDHVVGENCEAPPGERDPARAHVRLTRLNMAAEHIVIDDAVLGRLVYSRHPESGDLMRKKTAVLENNNDISATSERNTDDSSDQNKKKSEEERMRKNCTICGESCSLTYYKTHVASHSTKKVPCVGKKIRANLLTKHTKTHKRSHVPPKSKMAANRTIMCEYCGEEVLAKYYSRHVLRHKDADKVTCDVCSKRFHAHRIAGHVATHAPGYVARKQVEETVTCETCGHALRKSNVRRHMHVHHGVGAGNKPWTSVTCEQCGKVCQPQHYKRHLKQHEEGSVKCDTCDKVFANKSSWKQHMVRHSDVKTFICDVCGAGFYKSGDLVRHRGTHAAEEEKEFACEICGKRYHTAAMLKEHVRAQHEASTDRKYQCTTCGKGFTTLTRYREHVYIHTGERPYVCQLCDKAFSATSSLRKHLKLVHQSRLIGEKYVPL